MGTLKLHTTKLRLSKTEQAKLERSLRDLASSSSKQIAKELNERFRHRHRFGQVLEAELRRVGFNVEKLRRFANPEKVRLENARLEKAFLARIKEPRERAGRRSGGRPEAVFDLNESVPRVPTSGYARPPYDFTWTHHTKLGPGENWNHEANPNTGRLYARGGAGETVGHPREVHSFATLGFWFIPDRVGVLSVSIAPPIFESGFSMAEWHDVGASYGHISLAITSYPRTPPGFTELRVVDRDELWWDTSRFFEHTKHQQHRPAYSMSVNTVVDTSHNYLCWAQLEAGAHGENGGGHGEAQIIATVGGFLYVFL